MIHCKISYTALYIISFISWCKLTYLSFFIAFTNNGLGFKSVLPKDTPTKHPVDVMTLKLGAPCHQSYTLTLSQTTSFGLFQTERLCRQKF